MNQAYSYEEEAKKIEDHVSDRVLEFYTWKKALDYRPTTADIDAKIKELNELYIEILAVKKWTKYNGYFMDTVQFLTANDLKIRKEIESEQRKQQWQQ